MPPNPFGYILVMAEVDPAEVNADVTVAEEVSIESDAVSVNAKRADLHRALAAPRESLSAVTAVRSVSVFEAVLFAPGSLDRFAPRGAGGRPARFDSLIVVETDSPAASESVVEHKAFVDLMTVVRDAGSYADYQVWENTKKIDDVDRGREGVFLFKFFFAEDPQELRDIWDHTAGWWLKYGKMVNSELLRPCGASDYALMNNARWDEMRPAAEALRHPSYWDFVLANIDAQRATAMPGWYRMVAGVPA